MFKRSRDAINNYLTLRIVTSIRMSGNSPRNPFWTSFCLYSLKTKVIWQYYPHSSISLFLFLYPFYNCARSWNNMSIVLTAEFYFSILSYNITGIHCVEIKC